VSCRPLRHGADVSFTVGSDPESSGIGTLVQAMAAFDPSTAVTSIPPVQPLLESQVALAAAQ